VKDWVKELYTYTFTFKAPIKDLRSYICNGSNSGSIEWIEDDEYPRQDDGFRYGDIDRLIKHELHYALREK
jgi:hypothetical protein